MVSSSGPLSTCGERYPKHRLCDNVGACLSAEARCHQGRLVRKHESTIHLFAHPRRMMSCSIVDDPGIVEGGRPNQIVGPDHDHGQLGNARTGPHALGINAPPASSRQTSGAHGDLRDG